MTLSAPVAAACRGLVDYEESRSIGRRLRSARGLLLLEAFPDLPRYRVLDLGGTGSFWRTVPERPAHVTLLNVLPTAVDASDSSWLRSVVGDACDPPADLRAERWDLVVSNSVIEHVGGVGPRRAFASAVRSMADRYWIQTPYRYFPVEPHWLFPGFQFLPLVARARIAARWPINPVPSADVAAGVGDALDVELLSATELRHLFPEAGILRERFLGLTKSLIAVRA